jgi:hypothetical protein
MRGPTASRHSTIEIGACFGANRLSPARARIASIVSG